jgi:hypothetical protein
MAKLIGTDPNQVPTNGDLGDLAYQNKESVKVDNLQVDGTINENVTIDSSGNLLVGTTELNLYNNSSDEYGTRINATGTIQLSSDGTLAYMNRQNSDGNLIQFRKAGATVGSIGTRDTGALEIGSGDVYLQFNGANDWIKPVDGSGNNKSGVDLGTSGAKFDNLYLSGGVYLGGTGSANYLDDYEEGTWTAGLSGQNSVSIINPSSTHNTYVKVGNLVHVQGYVDFSGTDTSGSNIMITGLPFSSKLNVSSTGSLILQKGNGRSINIYIGSNDTRLVFYSTDNSSSESWNPINYNEVGQLTFHFQITYITA